MASAPYWAAVRATVVFTLALSAVTLGVALAFAFAAHHVLRGRAAYKTLILIPYAIAPAISGIVWAFLFNPKVGPVAGLLHAAGISWDPLRYSGARDDLVVLASAWKQVSYNFLFLFAALLAVPRSILEAAAVDGAGPIRRFVSIVAADPDSDAVLSRRRQFRLRAVRNVRRWSMRRPAAGRPAPRRPSSTRSISTASSRSISALRPRSR